MRAAAHIREYGGTLEHFWIEAVKDCTDAEYLDAREIPASLVTELATDLNGAVLQAANGHPTQLYVIVPVDGTLRISFGAGADLEKAARPERPRISVWMLPAAIWRAAAACYQRTQWPGKRLDQLELVRIAERHWCRTGGINHGKSYHPELYMQEPDHNDWV